MTIIIDKAALRHYAPKEMHDHLNAFDAYLVQAAAKNPVIKRWIENPTAIFSVKESFPIVHLVALYKDGKWRYFFAPADRYKRAPEHRLVSSDQDNEMQGMQPWLRLEVVTDPNLTSVFDLKTAQRLKDAINAEQRDEVIAPFTELMKQTVRPASILTIPLAMMKKGKAQRYLQHRFTLYQHIIGAGHEYPDDGPFYVGITSRDWKKRWGEHRAAIVRGSPLKFHRAYRERLAAKQLTYVHHKVMGVAKSLEQIQELEEMFVAAHWTDQRLLNMIPGGKAGIAYMREHGMLSKNVIPTPDQVEKVLEDWLRTHPRKGLPAPWVAAKWEDDDYAAKVICGAEGRLSIEQILAIRAMAVSGVAAQEIATQVGARNKEQVQRVIDGKTYARVRGV